MKPSENDWTPDVGVGDIRFGEPISKLIEAGILHHVIGPIDPEGKGWFAMGDVESPAVFLDENDLTKSIICDEEMIYNGNNLLGMEIADVIALLGQEPDEYGEEIELDEDDSQITAEFDSLGLQLWLRDGVAVSATVFTVIEDDD